MKAVIPEEIGALKNLTILRLSTLRPSSINTTIPQALSKLAHLEVLYLNGARVYGTLPGDFRAWPSLLEFEINRHSELPNPYLVGSVPPSIVSSRYLKILTLVNTGLTRLARTDQTPTNLRELRLSYSTKLECDLIQFSNSYWLEVMDLKATQTQGDIGFIGQLSRLRELNLADTLVYGPIPDDMWSLKHLERINFYNLRVFGTIGREIGKMANLTSLELFYTAIRGSIPREIVSCSKLESLRIISTNITGEIPAEIGNLSELTSLDLTGLRLSGTIPSSIGNLKKLVELNLSSGLKGTIPKSFENLTLLFGLDLSGNQLSGSIPDLMHVPGCRISLSSNLLTGTIPERMAQICGEVSLHTNLLGPDISSNLFLNRSKHTKAFLIDISHNKFVAPLPLPPSLTNDYDFAFIASHNTFYGTIPSEYCTNCNTLAVDWNNMTGTIDHLVDPSCLIHRLYVNNNGLSGTIGRVSGDSLAELDISYNKFATLPQLLAPKLSWFRASHNLFAGRSEVFWYSIQTYVALEYLDVSRNQLTCPPSFHSILTLPSLETLSVADNNFECTLFLDTEGEVTSSLQNLDLSKNTFAGAFPIMQFPYLASLNLADNQFFGMLILSNMPKLTSLDISFNEFSFPCSLFSGLPFLIDIKAQSNNIYGTLVFDDLDALQSANFSRNALTAAPDLSSLAQQFAVRNLIYLSIAENAIPQFASFDSSNSGLTTSQTSTPSKTLPINCYKLSVAEKGEIQFIFDEDLFSYSQCQCNEDHFGLPPDRCQACPYLLSGSCAGRKLLTDDYSFIYAVSESDYPSTSNTSVSQSFETLFHLPSSSSPSGQRTVVLQSEPCIYSAMPSETNCDHLEIAAEDLFNASIPLSHILDKQCIPGSSGRLCSKCLCNPNIQNNYNCYYSSITKRCLKCRTTFTFGVSMLLIFLPLLMIVLLLTVILFFILKNRRKPQKPWAKLPFWRRFFYRLVYLTSLGTISILINHLQLYDEFSDSKALFMKLFTGSVEGFGLQCAFPFLAHPMTFLLLKLSLPFLIIGVVGISVALAELCYRLLSKYAVMRVRHRLKSSKHTHSSQYVEQDISSDFVNNEDEEDDSLFSEETNVNTYLSDYDLLPHSSNRIVHYPALALFTSLSISIVKFFYFSTALSAHEYLFWRYQKDTYTPYVLNHPYMDYTEGKSLMWASIPSILIFDLLLPAGYFLLCFKLRHSYNTPRISIYFGSLFEAYAKNRYWWGMNDILRKMTISIVLRSIPPPTAFLSLACSLIISATLMGQLALLPWKRKYENLLDSLSSILILLRLIVTLEYNQPHYRIAALLIFCLQLAFVLLSIIVILYQVWTGTTDYEKRFARYEAAKSSDAEVYESHLKGNVDEQAISNTNDDETLSDMDETSPNFLTSDPESSELRHLL